jgi:hypothetical protein
MASSGESSASWADVVKELMDSFLLLRDIFGYALPGAAFLAIGVLSGRLQLAELQNLLGGYKPPAWAVTGVGIAACYTIGHMLAAIAYLPIDLKKTWLQWTKPELLPAQPTEINATDLYLQHYYPDLFQSMVRRETMTLLTFSLCAALFFGWLVFWRLHPTFGQIVFWGAVLLIIDNVTGMSHLRRVRRASQEAGARIKADEDGARASAHAEGGDLQSLAAGILQAAADAAKKPPKG